MNNLKGQGVPVVGTIVVVVIAAAMLMIGPLVFGYIRDAMTTPMDNLNSASYNNTVTSVENNTWSGFELLSVSVIVLAAVAIIGIVLLLRTVA